MLAETTGVCPACGLKTFYFVEYLHETPYFGPVLISSGRCSNCGYRHFDLEYGETGRSTRITFKPKDGEDVAKTLIARSKTCSIKSPDLGFELEPGPSAEPFVSTLEGFLHRVIDYAERMKTLTGDEKIDEFISRVRKAIEAGGFAIVLEDPLGKCAIIPRSKDAEITVEYLNGDLA